MKARFEPCRLAGSLSAPPSKSMVHRYLIGAALCGERSVMQGVDYSEDILATIDCLQAMGAVVTCMQEQVILESGAFLQINPTTLRCRESGSTLRFFLPLALCTGRPVTLCGEKRLFCRPLDVYEEFCRERGYLYEKGDDYVRVCGKLTGGTYTIRGDSSSQFLSGLLFALVSRGTESVMHISSSLVSRPYVHMTIAALYDFGAQISMPDAHTIVVGKSAMHAFSGRMEGDYSNAAVLDAFNWIGSHVSIENLRADSIQGDKIYASYFQQLAAGMPTLSVSDCPDLAPVLIAMAALKNGAVLTGTERLKEKESDRGLAMLEELQKLGGTLYIGKNTITVPKQTLRYQGKVLNGHRDHRIVMACSVLLSTTGGEIDGIEAVQKSYPHFFADIQRLGARVQWEGSATTQTSRLV